jgi:hypothetical protein
VQLVLVRLASKVQRVSRELQESKVPLVLMARLELLVLLEMLELLEYRGQHLGHCQLQYMTMDSLTTLERQLLFKVDIITEQATH